MLHHSNVTACYVPTSAATRILSQFKYPLNYRGQSSLNTFFHSRLSKILI